MPAFRRFLVPFAVLVLLAAGCGSDDDQPALSGDVESTEATGEGEDTTTTAGEGGTDASASIESPADGATVARRFDIAMAAEGVTIEPSGEVREGAGHFHVMVDADCLEAGETIPRDDQHVHFGGGQTEGQLFLEPGTHELCLQVGDGAHVALDVTDQISVTVDESLPYITLGVPEGDTVSSPVAVTMEAQNLTIEPAGEVREDAGHFHVMVDAECLEPGETIPNDDQHLHFGDGSTEAELELDPGEHTLCLQVGDGAHVALPVTHRVTVTVA